MQKGDNGIHSQMSSLRCSKVTDPMQGCLENLSVIAEPGSQVNATQVKQRSGHLTIFLRVWAIH